MFHPMINPTHVEDILGDTGFRVFWKTSHDLNFVNIEVHQIMGSWADTGVKVFDDNGNSSDTPTDSSLHLHGIMKWDACCHFTFGDGDGEGYLHFCGPDSFADHAELMLHIYENAPKHIPKADLSMWK